MRLRKRHSVPTVTKTTEMDRHEALFILCFLSLAVSTITLVKLKSIETKIMAALDDLTNAVAAEDTVIDSAITLLKGLKDALDAAGTDPVRLAALSADIAAKTQALADAVAANTPTH